MRADLAYIDAMATAEAVQILTGRTPAMDLCAALREAEAIALQRAATARNELRAQRPLVDADYALGHAWVARYDRFRSVILFDHSQALQKARRCRSLARRNGWRLP